MKKLMKSVRKKSDYALGLAAVALSGQAMANDAGKSLPEQLSAQIDFAPIEAGVLIVAGGAMSLTIGIVGYRVIRNMVKSGH